MSKFEQGVGWANLNHGLVLLRVDDDHLAAIPYIHRHLGTDLCLPGLHPNIIVNLKQEQFQKMLAYFLAYTLNVTVAKPHHFNAAPAQCEKHIAAPAQGDKKCAAPAPTQTDMKPNILKEHELKAFLYNLFLRFYIGFKLEYFWTRKIETNCFKSCYF
jgi:hypothetical protein